MQPPLTPDATAVTDPTDDPPGRTGRTRKHQRCHMDRACSREAADTVRRERIEARAGKHCTFCDFASLCPAKTPEVSVVDLVGDVNEVVDVGGDDEMSGDKNVNDASKATRSPRRALGHGPGRARWSPRFSLER